MTTNSTIYYTGFCNTTFKYYNSTRLHDSLCNRGISGVLEGMLLVLVIVMLLLMLIVCIQTSGNDYQTTLAGSGP